MTPITCCNIYHYDVLSAPRIYWHHHCKIHKQLNRVARQIMKSTARLISFITCCAILASAAPVLAGDNAFRDIFEDAFYGGAAGALVGGALLAFTKKPANHLDYIGYGTASGVLVGSAYGVVKSAKALAQIDNGTIKFALPTVIPDLGDSPASRQTNITWRAALLRGTFW
jgi:hypothetical protein